MKSYYQFRIKIQTKQKKKKIEEEEKTLSCQNNEMVHFHFRSLHNSEFPDSMRLKDVLYNSFRFNVISYHHM